MRRTTIFASIVVAVTASVAAVRAEVPSPAQLRATIVVSGHTSTAVEIPIVKVGQRIPRTYAGDRIANVPGFDFWVSEHFALRTNMGEGYARLMLEVSELAHPHWVALVGADVPDPDLRMFLTCADDTDDLHRAIVADLGMGPLGGFAGGFTAAANMSAYNYPSGTLQHHQRALVIHENLHMLNLITNGTPGTEGPTYTGQLHCYDPATKRLTVSCFDMAPTVSYIDEGLAELRTRFIPMNEAVRRLWSGGRGAAAVYQQFFLTDPDRNLKWRIWRDAHYAGNVNADTNRAVMEGIHGSLDRLDAEWARWVRDRKSTFHFVEWGWEQDGNQLWAYGFPKDARYWSQTDLRLPPGEQPIYDPLRMDYPSEPMPASVGPVTRGVAEPAIGFVVAGVGGNCWGGMGLGVAGRDLCQVVIAGDRQLVIDGRSIGIERREAALTADLRLAAAKDGGRHGLTVTIGKEALGVTVRAGTAPPLAAMTVSVPLAAEQRRLLLERPLAVIGRNGYPRITPWVDDRRRLPPDLARPAPANRWRFAAMERLETLYRAAWRLGDSAPESLRSLKGDLLRTIDTPAQAGAVEDYERRIAGVIRDVKHSSAAAETQARAMADLAGLFLQTRPPRAGSRPDLIAVGGRVTGRLTDPVECGMTVAVDGVTLPQVGLPRATLEPLRPRWCEGETVATAGQPLDVTYFFTITWRGETFVVPLRHTTRAPSDPR